MRNSSICWYFENSDAQSAAVSGGIAPVRGRHSVMDNPLSVKRVRPPTAIITTTSVNNIYSHTRIAPRAPPLPRSMTPTSATCFSLVPTSSKMLRFFAIPALMFHARGVT